MEKKDIIKKLEHLAKVDADAFHAYGQAMEKMEDFLDIRGKLSKFQQDHKNHFDRLSEKIKALGEEPPKFSKDFKGYLIGGFTAMRSVTGVQGALSAMISNEKITNREYEKSLDESLPQEVLDMLREHYKDEKRHLQYVQERYGFLTGEKDTPDRGQYY